ncbi:MAG: PAS domain S-box protein, partial [Candidatus Aminicenantes bacterium]|nr:PAS domain S-box protein [Candidatus Aminicenantes bacterium]
DGFFIVQGGSFEYFNPSFARMIGIPPDELSKKGWDYIFNLVHPEDKDKLLNWLQSSKDKLPLQILRKIRLVTENQRLIEANFSRSQNQEIRIIAHLRDVTEIFEYSQKLKIHRNIFDLVVEEANTPIFITEEGLIKYANQAVYNVFGYKPDEVIGKKFINYLAEKDRQKIIELYSCNEPSRFVPKLEFSIIHKEGRLVEVEMQVKRLEYNRIVSELAIMVDISERKKNEEKLKEALADIRKAFGATISLLNKLVEIKDPYTSGHQKRVAWMARQIAQEMKLPAEKIDRLRLAAEVHDIGKILIPAEILNKAGNLTNNEWAIIKNHAHLGYELLKDLNLPWPVAEIVYQHHERLDGSGYLRGLKGEEILLEARILAVADVFEAMTSFRPYRPARNVDEAIRELEKQNLYDQNVVEALKKLLKENRLMKLK